MSRSRLRSLLFFASLLLLTTSVALAGETISLTVDATKTPQKLLRSHEVIPVKPGPLTIYYPKWIPGEHGPAGPISSVTGLKFEGNGKVIPWLRDTLDTFTFHVDIPAGVSQLDATFDFIEPDGNSATDVLIVLEWNDVVLYPAGTLATEQTLRCQADPARWLEVRLVCSPSIRNPAIRSGSSPSRSTCSSTRLSSPANSIARSTSPRPASPSTTSSTWSPTAKPLSTSAQQTKSR